MDKNAPGSNATESATRHRDDTKIGRILAALKSPEGLNRFEAEWIGDHCLNSTVARLRAEGHSISSEWERVPNRFGGFTRVLRYRCLSGPHDGTQ